MRSGKIYCKISYENLHRVYTVIAKTSEVINAILIISVVVITYLRGYLTPSNYVA